MTKKLFNGSLAFAGLMTLMIAALGFRFNDVSLLPDQGPSWYYWKLPERSFIASFTAWSGYLLHQICVWFAIFRLQKTKSQKYQVALLIINAFFILLHFLQTHIWYEGLAQDVPVFSSQGSVIIMLVLILLMENDRRGLAFGLKIQGFQTVKTLVRKYHGYFIAWAVVYTFWYHPMVSTSGHLFGFFYMFLLMIQLATPYSKFHMNKYWLFVLEVMVLLHGTAVAIWQNNGMWPMFAFGFGFMAVSTQIYGISLSKLWIRVIQVAYMAAAIFVFMTYPGRSIGDIHQITWIPIIEYGLVCLFLFMNPLASKLVKT